MSLFKLHHQFGTTEWVTPLKLSSRNFVTLLAYSSTTRVKSKRLPFQPSTRVTTTPLELIRCDIWGPSPTLFDLGYKYYILFIDDFSRFHWIYPMTTRAESIVCFKHFKQLNENLLSCKIKTFQTDGALELVQGSLRKFLDDSGIAVCVSWPHTPQQNGVAERKHRHITDMGNTMAFQACLPKFFWYDSFLTATFVINRTPSKLLADKTPYEILFHKEPDLSILKVFGCTCYPYLGPYRKDKLSPKSSKCTFIGYSPMHKGYKCYDNSTKKIFISRHVVFEETTFPFCTCASIYYTPADSTTILPISFSLESAPSPVDIDLAKTSSGETTEPLNTIESSPVDSTELTSLQPPPEPILPLHTMTTRSKMGITKTKQIPDFVTNLSVAHPLHSAFVT